MFVRSSTLTLHSQRLSNMCLHACNVLAADDQHVDLAQAMLRANLASVRRLTLQSTAAGLLNTVTHPTALISLDYRYKGAQLHVLMGTRLHLAGDQHSDERNLL